MSSTLVGRQGSGFSPGLGELVEIPREQLQPLNRAQLLPGEEAASLPAAPEPQGAMIPLTRFLGPVLTVANPVWTGDPVPRMRSLQKSLVAFSLTLAEGERSELMSSINVVEGAVQLRLRLQQMRMTEAEMQVNPQGEGKS
ncbi:hypothetical protein [Collimonas humicola]|uniref:hypothetical protein n=1 Tax=Collimonas humicola TaxID=2825886 RepID=UPI001B8BC7EB|nr:hypothetical protein [Collimonas humicola]